jgi:hypothetical protein
VEDQINRTLLGTVAKAPFAKNALSRTVVHTLPCFTILVVLMDLNSGLKKRPKLFGNAGLRIAGSESLHLYVAKY